MMVNIDSHDVTLEELFPKLGSNCTNIVLAKSIVADVSKVQHHLASLGLIDIGNYHL